MARLTPQEILELSEPIEEIYNEIVDKLLINIAKRFEVGQMEGVASANWEIRKLAQLGQLSRENLEIIQKYSGRLGTLAREALETAVLRALKDEEPKLRKAAEKAILKPPLFSSPLMSTNIRQSLVAYYNQAAVKLNMVNTTMLQSSLDVYRKMVGSAAAAGRLSKAQQILNTATGEAVTAVTTPQAAARSAIIQLEKIGLKGFYDRSGRGWSPEAYVTMDIRTTLHNASIQAVFDRNKDYGNNLFYVSTHDGARPLCYPWQAKVLSTDGTSGTTTDLNDEPVPYVGLDQTSYGEPAGLFGINCGHYPITFIPGLTMIRGEPQPKAENDRVYRESQEQRAIERRIRAAKRRAVEAATVRIPELFEDAAKELERAEAQMDAFIENTGRTPRPNRTQVVGYTRKIAQDVRRVRREADAEQMRT